MTMYMYILNTVSIHVNIISDCIYFSGRVYSCMIDFYLYSYCSSFVFVIIFVTPEIRNNSI